jgi:hypothetical protein
MCTTTPNWNSILASWWGPETDDAGAPLAIIEAASNIVCGTNPQYSIQDFFTNYPQFGGVVQQIPQITLVEDSPDATFTGTILSPGLVPGSPISGPGIPDGTVILSSGSGGFVMSNPATDDESEITISVWNASPVPVAVVLIYIAAATACLVQARWLDLWTLAMGLYVAHFLTLWARAASAGPGATLLQLGSLGLAFGIQVSKAVGDVSVGYQALIIGFLENYGAWNLTVFGQQLATFAQVVGLGGMLIY